MKKLTIIFLLIICLGLSFCKRSDEIAVIEQEEIVYQDIVDCPMVMANNHKNDIVFEHNNFYYVIFPFHWNTNYYITVKNKSHSKTYHGIILATAFYRMSKLHENVCAEITLRPKETIEVPVYIRINILCVFNPPPPPLPKVTHCLVTFVEI